MNDKNIIVCTYANLANYKSSENESTSEYKSQMYLQASMVMLISAKLNNPTDDVAFVTNIYNLDSAIIDRLNNFDIKVLVKEFSEFTFAEKYSWSLAFYKLCALKHVTENFDYCRIMLLDLDTYFISGVQDMWTEANYNILLLDLEHSISVPQACVMNEEYHKLYPSRKKNLLTNYGGELICGKRDLIKVFLQTCEKIYRDMIEQKFQTRHGDEFIVSIAAHESKYLIKNAAPYIARFWTRDFYLVSTKFKYNSVNILHLPDEKYGGFRIIYLYLIKFNKLPSNKLAYSIFGLPYSSRPFLRRNFIMIA